MGQLAFLQYERPQTVKRLPLRETPAFRAANTPTTCNTTELLAAVVGGANQIEIAQDLLAKYQSLRGIYNAHPDELAVLPGLSQSSATRIRAALALGLRFSGESDEQPTISSPADAAALLLPEMSALEVEHLRVVLLNTRNRVIDIIEVYKGSVNSSQVRIAEVFRDAIRRNAPSIIVAHNHPTGAPRSM